MFTGTLFCGQPCCGMAALLCGLLLVASGAEANVLQRLSATHELSYTVPSAPPQPPVQVHARDPSLFAFLPLSLLSVLALSCLLLHSLPLVYLPLFQIMHPQMRRSMRKECDSLYIITDHRSFRFPPHRIQSLTSRGSHRYQTVALSYLLIRLSGTVMAAIRKYK